MEKITLHNPNFDRFLPSVYTKGRAYRRSDGR